MVTTKYMRQNEVFVDTFNYKDFKKFHSSLKDVLINILNANESFRHLDRKEGLDIFAALIKKLTELGRTKDIEKAVYDRSYRDELISEFVMNPTYP